ncbi:MBL fold metallo-hydrolase [Virgibacillus xinjiangensis]|uniref:MBL fold metallo-hydrolase n=1 Tax=Virgibacillus xinjiangensis TaxID=393090 RepID=A0ABV7CQZ4_9BACI
MLEQISKDIYRLVVEFPPGNEETNCYLIKGANGYTVVDTGIYSEHAIQIWRKALGTDIKVEKVVLTHVHQDHIGLAGWFQRELGVPVVMSEKGYQLTKRLRSASNVERLNNILPNYGGPRLPSDMMEDDSFIFAVEPDQIFHEQDKIYLGDDAYEVIWTPGHAPDHFCFYNRERKLMIVGDHILKAISPVIGLWEGEEGNPLKDYYHSLKAVEPYETALALPGHGEVMENFQERVRQTRQKHDQRLEQVMSLVNEKPTTAAEVCRKIYGERPFPSMLSTFMASLTRLLYLEEQGRIRRVEVDGVSCFHPIEEDKA